MWRPAWGPPHRWGRSARRSIAPACTLETASSPPPSLPPLSPPLSPPPPPPAWLPMQALASLVSLLRTPPHSTALPQASYPRRAQGAPWVCQQTVHLQAAPLAYQTRRKGACQREAHSHWSRGSAAQRAGSSCPRAYATALHMQLTAVPWELTAVRCQLGLRTTWHSLHPSLPGSRLPWLPSWAHKPARHQVARRCHAAVWQTLVAAR